MGLISELVSVFSKRRPFDDVLEELERMLLLTQQMVELAHRIYWGLSDAREGRVHLAEQDIDVNRLERRIRKLLGGYAVLGTEADATYALRIMSLVKDVERLGDYAKNMAELREYREEPLPEGSIGEELRAISNATDAFMDRSVRAVVRNDAEEAKVLTAEGRALCKQCDELVAASAASQLEPSAAVSVALGARYDKRIVAHLLNVLSSLIMPLHKIDYYDESAIAS